MTITQMTIKIFGKKETLFRVLDANGEVIQVCETLQQARDFVNAA